MIDSHSSLPPPSGLPRASPNLRTNKISVGRYKILLTEFHSKLSIEQLSRGSAWYVQEQQASTARHAQGLHLAIPPCLALL